MKYKTHAIKFSENLIHQSIQIKVSHKFYETLCVALCSWLDESPVMRPVTHISSPPPPDVFTATFMTPIMRESTKRRGAHSGHSCKNFLLHLGATWNVDATMDFLSRETLERCHWGHYLSEIQSKVAFNWRYKVF